MISLGAGMERQFLTILILIILDQWWKWAYADVCGAQAAQITAYALTISAQAPQATLLFKYV